ncbi:DUF2283 domain-containing protein [Candidatus Woesearchaeota archaeon]|nr:DUF2283 domain-containing protein [Candidatus Woesearchaeota archaeon]
METRYDNDEDILNVEIREGKYWKSVELDNGVVIDIDKEGNILAMEVLKASKVFSKTKEIIENAKQEA